MGIDPIAMLQPHQFSIMSSYILGGKSYESKSKKKVRNITGYTVRKKRYSQTPINILQNNVLTYFTFIFYRKHLRIKLNNSRSRLKWFILRSYWNLYEAKRINSQEIKKANSNIRRKHTNYLPRQ